MAGGKRGAPKGNQNARRVPHGREWIRSVVDEPERRKRFLAAIDAALANGNPDAYLKAFAHGYGNPPQALDVQLGQIPTVRVVIEHEGCNGAEHGL